MGTPGRDAGVLCVSLCMCLCVIKEVFVRHTPYMGQQHFNIWNRSMVFYNFFFFLVGVSWGLWYADRAGLKAFCRYPYILCLLLFYERTTVLQDLYPVLS